MKFSNTHLAFLAWLLFAAILLHFHEPWRDELQSWAIAKESHSLSQLLYFSRYEGHPSAWYFLLFSITRLSADFQAVQWFHAGIMAMVAALILWKSPFTRLQKILVISGYFFLYEYGTLARNYAIGILLACCFCILLKDVKKQWLTLIACLFAMMQCNVFAAMLACAFFCPLFFSGGKIARENRHFLLPYFAGALIFVAGFILAAFDMQPPADTTFMPEWTWEKPALERALGSFFHAFAPVPKLEIDFWNSHILASFVHPEWLPKIEAALGILLFVICIFTLRKCPAALVFFMLSVAAITVFLSVKYAGFMRHHGHYFLAYFFAQWMKNRTAEHQFGGTVLPGKFFTLILTLHFLAIIPAAYFDIKYPFSQSQNIAAYLRNNYPDRQLVGHFDYATSPVSFHLGQPIYYPNAGKEGTYILWNTERMNREVPDVTLIINDLCRQKGDFLLVTSYPIPLEKRGNSIRLIRSFAPAIVPSETYYLHEVNGK